MNEAPKPQLKPLNPPQQTAKKPCLAPDMQCKDCRFAVDHGNLVLRCHLLPPAIKMPYDTMSAWPVVPVQGGGCRSWEGKE